MVPLDDGDLYLVHELDADYDFNSDQYFIAKLTKDQLKDITKRYNRRHYHNRGDLDILLIRDMEVEDYASTCKQLGLKI